MYELRQDMADSRCRFAGPTQQLVEALEAHVPKPTFISYGELMDKSPAHHP